MAHTEGMPSDMEGDDSFECRVSGYKSSVFGILPDNYMARTASARLSEKLQYVPRLPSARSDRLRGILGACARWWRRGGGGWFAGWASSVRTAWWGGACAGKCGTVACIVDGAP